MWCLTSPLTFWTCLLDVVCFAMMSHLLLEFLVSHRAFALDGDSWQCLDLWARCCPCLVGFGFYLLYYFTWCVVSVLLYTFLKQFRGFVHLDRMKKLYHLSGLTEWMRLSHTATRSDGVILHQHSRHAEGKNLGLGLVCWERDDDKQNSYP